MPTELTVTATYPGDPDEIFAQALSFWEMKDAIRGIATYHGLPDRDVAAGKTITVDVTLFGMFTTKDHVMFVEKLDRRNRLIQSREHNPGIRRSDHTLSVQPGAAGAIWIDRVIVDAGWQTFLPRGLPALSIQDATNIVRLSQSVPHSNG